MNTSKNVLEDKFGRVHNYLRISVTDACNLRCVYCMPSKIKAGSSDSLMKVDEIDSLATIFRDFGVNKIRLTGGEPLVRKDIREIFSVLSGHGTELTMTTNGLLLHQYIDDLLKYNFSSVNISLDTIQPETFKEMTGSGKTSLIIDNIKRSLAAGLTVKINAVLMKGINDNMIHDLISITESHDIEVRFIEFMPFLGNKWDQKKVVTRNDILYSLKERFNDVEKLEDKPEDTAKKYRVKNHKGTFGIITTMSEPFCENCNRLRLTSDGKMRNCLFAQNEVDLLSALRNGEDVKKLILDNLLQKHEYTGGLDLSKSAGNRAMIKIGG